MIKLPEEVLPHTIQDDLIHGEQLQSLFIAVKKILNAPQWVQFLCPLEKSEPKRILKDHIQMQCCKPE